MELDTLGERLAASAPADPRLYYQVGDADAFWRRAACAPEFADQVRDIRAEGRRLLEEPIPELTYSLFAIFGERGSRLEYERVYFERRRRLNTFAFLSLLEPENPSHLTALQDILWSVCDEYTWCLPAHVSGTSANIRRTIDLFAAETGFTVSEVALLLGGRLAPLLRERIEEELEARIFAPYLANESGYWWETSPHNWSAVCAGSVGAAALLAVREPERLAAIVARAMGSMDCFLAGYGEDGACLEGLGYWNYGFGFYVYFADLLGKRTNGAVDLMRGDKVRRIAAFQQKAYLHADRVVNFADSAPRARVQIGLTHYLARLYPEVETPPASMQSGYLDDHCSRWAPALRSFIWYDAGRQGDEWREGSWYLPDAQWLISRCRLPSGDYGFAAKAGHNAEPHNHNDIGQFMLLADNEVFVADLGSGEYTRAYFSEGRYEYDCNGAQGHAVPIVEGELQRVGAESAAQILEASAGDEEDRLRFEMRTAYRVPHLQSLVRSFVWRKRDRERPALELTDEFRFAGAPGSIVERLVTLLPPEPAEGGIVIVRGAGERALRIRYDAEQLEPRMSAHTYNDHAGRPTPWYAVDFEVRRAAERPEHTIVFQLDWI